MKKYALLSVLAFSLFVCGCGNSKTKEEKYEKIMEEYARNYYEEYILDSVSGLDFVEVSIANLENVNLNAGSNYDLKKLAACTKDSYVRFDLNDNQRDIDSVEYHLNCK